MENNVKTEFMSNKKRWLKNVGFLILYWLFCLSSPFFVTFVLSDLGGGGDVLVWLFPLSVFVPPFLVFIPFLFAKFNDWKEKIIFILVGLIIPLTYSYLIVRVVSSIRFGW